MLAQLVPGPLVRWFARPYVAGDSLDAALGVAESVQRDRGLLTTLDLLGEDVTEPAQVEASILVYRAMIDALGDGRFPDAATRPSVSVKPSAFTTGDREASRKPIIELARRAHGKGVAFTIDMEDRRWTDFTIDLSVRLFEEGLDVGTVLQTRLHRTEADLARIPAKMRLRLVIGIYPEPAEVATTDKREMKERMLAYAKTLLDRGVFVEFATHDEEFVDRFVQELAPAAPDRCEVQMLLGVPRAEQQARLRAANLPVRIYVPFATGWKEATAYLRRRMKESPSTVWLVLRNLVAGRSDR